MKIIKLGDERKKSDFYNQKESIYGLEEYF